MPDISVSTAATNDGWTFGVQVAESNGQTRHSVTLSQRDFQQLTEGKQTTPEELVRKTFEFLLERGPKHQILRQFDLPAIGRYFPDYPAAIRSRL
ncbi:MAG: hypothetical protein HYZ96_00905 [Candidatus Omnitrophica bacterium]|nr:hypothetical protein [Candidatus Omnitrophota bacterium]